MPLPILISGPGLEQRPPNVGPCNSAEPPGRLDNRGRPAGSSGQEGREDSDWAPRPAAPVRACQLLEPPGLLGRILLPLMLPCVFFIVCLFCFVFCRSGLGSAKRLAELSVRAFEVGAQDWGACCVREGVVIPADAEQGALGVRVRCRGQTRSTTRPPNPSFRDG